jgi:hypothetical protein
MRCPRNICHSKVRLRFGGWQTWRDYFFRAQQCRTRALLIVPALTGVAVLGRRHTREGSKMVRTVLNCSDAFELLRRVAPFKPERARLNLAFPDHGLVLSIFHPL